MAAQGKSFPPLSGSRRLPSIRHHKLSFTPPTSAALFEMFSFVLMCIFYPFKRCHARADKNPFKSHEPEKRKQPKRNLANSTDDGVKIVVGLVIRLCQEISRNL